MAQIVATPGSSCTWSSGETMSTDLHHVPAEGPQSCEVLLDVPRLLMKALIEVNLLRQR